jgi:hypothetical protein
MHVNRRLAESEAHIVVPDIIVNRRRTDHNLAGSGLWTLPTCAEKQAQRIVEAVKGSADLCEPGSMWSARLHVAGWGTLQA